MLKDQNVNRDAAQLLNSSTNVNIENKLNVESTSYLIIKYASIFIKACVILILDCQRTKTKLVLFVMNTSHHSHPKIIIYIAQCIYYNLSELIALLETCKDRALV